MTMTTELENRIRNIKDIIKTKKFDAFLVTDPLNRKYLSGFTGTSGWIVVTSEKIFLITDLRYTQQANLETGSILNCEILIHKVNIVKALARILQKNKIKKLGFEAKHLTIYYYEKLKGEMPYLKFFPTENIVENLRMIKTEAEINYIKYAVDIAKKSFESIKGKIKAGVLEKDLALELEYQMKKNGADEIAFPIIVASGYRSALPHGVATTKKIKEKELVLIDFGAVCKNYLSDLTYTVCIGIMNKKQEKIFKTIRTAQELAISKIKPGVKLKYIDSIARGFIKKQGYANYFTHGLGHGIGMAVHELPVVSGKSKEELKEGMVVTVEPGIYISGWGGVRLEKDVVVRKNGTEVLG
ncbi:MAG: Xaa-Pro peptidase family protein [Candidatus Firestonebacteria bacterium]